MNPWDQPPGPYAGIGSRSTPARSPEGYPTDVLYLMERIARRLHLLGFTLRSGAAPGADSAFSGGAWDAGDDGAILCRTELYLPWPGFEGRRGKRVRLDRPTEQAYEIAARYHPAWSKLGRGPRALMARNTHQVLGAACNDPARFVVCWTPDGATTKTTSKTGGTGQALRIAAAHQIPIWNLAREDHRRMWGNFVGNV